jgi:hypothetical protein
MRSKLRQITGRPSTSEVSDSGLNDLINDYYQNRFPLDVHDSLLRDVYTRTITATDSGQYTLPEVVLKVSEPVKIAGSEITFTED